MSIPIWNRRDEWTVPRLMDARLESDPDSEFLDVNGERWTASALFAAANRLANTMIDFGVAQGDRIATLIENSSEAVISLFGANRAGAIGVPINTAYKGEYLRHQLADSGAKVLIVDAALAERAHRGRRHHRHARSRHRRRRERTDTGHQLAHVGRRHDRRRPATRRRGLSHRSQRVHLHGRHHRPVEGLRGQPQLHRHADQADRRRCGARAPDDVVWSPLPLFHYNAVTVMLVGTLLIGGRAAIYKKFSVSNFWPEINRVGATHASTLGSMVTLLVNDPMRPEAPDSGAAAGEQDPALHLRRADAAGGVGTVHRTLEHPAVRRGLRHDRGLALVVVAAGDEEQAQRGRGRQRRVLGRPDLRRRRQRAAARHPG